MNNTFAERLRAAMKQAGMNQTALSEKTGASKAAISQYLSGKNIPTMDRIQALAHATGVSAEDLLAYDAPAGRDQPIPAKKITTYDAARCLGKSCQFVRIGLQRGILPFGDAVPGVGGSWNYYINPARFKEYVGAELFDSFFGLAAGRGA